jgi:hypothetical protein
MKLSVLFVLVLDLDLALFEDEDKLSVYGEVVIIDNGEAAYLIKSLLPKRRQSTPLPDY